MYKTFITICIIQHFFQPLDFLQDISLLTIATRDERGLRGHSSDNYGPQHWGEKQGVSQDLSDDYVEVAHSLLKCHINDFTLFHTFIVYYIEKNRGV